MTPGQCCVFWGVVHSALHAGSGKEHLCLDMQVHLALYRLDKFIKH